MKTMELPHLTDSESVRQEASQAYGGLSDASAFVQAHKATLDPNVAAASLKQVDAEATASIQEGNFKDAQAAIDKEYGKGFTVIDAVVRGHAISAIIEDQNGMTRHAVAPFDEGYRPVTETVSQKSERIAQTAESHRGRLGAEARAEVERLVAEARQEIQEEMAEKYGKASETVDKERESALKDAESESEKEQKAQRRGGGRGTRSAKSSTPKGSTPPSGKQAGSGDSND